MSICDTEKYYTEYIEEQLPGAEIVRFHDHLNTCSTCKDRLDAFYQVHVILHSYQHPNPDARLLEEYHTDLKKTFTQISTNQPDEENTIFRAIRKIIYTKSPWVRTAETFVLVLIGIFVGWIIFYSGEEQRITIPDASYISKPITSTDLDYMSYYFQASEIILLEMSNMSDEDIRDVYDLYLNKEIAQKLLMRTFLVHEMALQLNDRRMLRFLSKMEMIMIELSNLNDVEVDESMEAIRMVINEQNLLEEVKVLQTVMEKEKTRSSTG
jgi:hypothetical protein